MLFFVLWFTRVKTNCQVSRHVLAHVLFFLKADLLFWCSVLCCRECVSEARLWAAPHSQRQSGRTRRLTYAFFFFFFSPAFSRWRSNDSHSRSVEHLRSGKHLGCHIYYLAHSWQWLTKEHVSLDTMKAHMHPHCKSSPLV